MATEIKLQTLFFDEVEVGQEVTPLVLDITPTMIVATAIATRDYQDVHHDRDLAQQKGSKDIFMNILTTNGFVGRFITDWTGPEAILKKVAIRLGAPNYPYDTMTMTGRVATKEVVGDEGIITVEVRGANSLGDHVTGTVELALPRGNPGGGGGGGGGSDAAPVGGEQWPPR
jgi:acyl dehydratase